MNSDYEIFCFDTLFLGENSYVRTQRLLLKRQYLFSFVYIHIFSRKEVFKINWKLSQSSTIIVDSSKS